MTIVFFLLSNTVAACTGIPVPQTHSHEQLVKRTENIVLARAFRPQLVNGELHTVKFYVTDVLKGSQEGNFDLTGFAADQNNGNTDFNKHNDLKFWAYSNTGNFKRLENCNLYGYFKQGEQYLIFLDAPYHPRSFEIVSSTDDAWYKEVIAIINKDLPKAAIENDTSTNPGAIPNSTEEAPTSPLDNLPTATAIE
ncbi:MAG: hypothetical protein ACRBCI_14350 [Cellvibrionaceae bacterium]